MGVVYMQASRPPALTATPAVPMSRAHSPGYTPIPALWWCLDIIRRPLPAQDRACTALAAAVSAPCCHSPESRRRKRHPYVACFSIPRRLRFWRVSDCPRRIIPQQPLRQTVRIRSNRLGAHLTPAHSARLERNPRTSSEPSLNPCPRGISSIDSPSTVHSVR